MNRSWMGRIACQEDGRPGSGGGTGGKAIQLATLGKGLHPTPEQRQASTRTPKQFIGRTTGFPKRAQTKQTKAPDRARNRISIPGNPIPDPLPALIAPEELIRSFTRLGDHHAVVARQFREEINRHAPGFRNGLILQVNHARKEFEKVPLGKNLLMVNSPDASRGFTSLGSAIPLAGPRYSRSYPTEKVFTLSEADSEKSAALVVRSIPPDRNTPTGTSLTVRKATLVRNSAE